MRYTTIIDITDQPRLYANKHARLVYLHLVLKAGYHDNDRDLAVISIRRLAQDTGLSMSATRHALGLLTAAQLIRRQGPAWIVRKWILEQPITSRPKSTAAARAKEIAKEQENRQREREQKQEAEARQRQELAAEGKTQFMLYYEDLMKKAAGGDIEAQELVKRHAKTYQQHQQANAGKSK